MRYLRRVIAAALVIYCLWSLLPSVGTAVWKLGLVELPADQVRYQPLMEATSWLQLVVWWTAIVLYLMAAWRLFRGGRAFLPFLVGFVVDVGNYAWTRSQGVYDRVMGEAITMDYVILAALVLAGAYIWWTERNARRTNATPRSPVALT